ncbi:hypothetical protein IMCC26256_11100 [Actinobacteria bacterium IMCC26256]|nr:hypothetical protein IMCC26256_11100 [Actinobacteria bacterium IMCC26256]
MLSHALSHARICSATDTLARREPSSLEPHRCEPHESSLLEARLLGGAAQPEGYYQNSSHNAVCFFGQFILRRAPRCKSPRRVFGLRVAESQATVASDDCWFNETWFLTCLQTYSHTRFHNVQSSSESLKTLFIGSSVMASLKQYRSGASTEYAELRSSVTSIKPVAYVTRALRGSDV